MSGVSLDEVMMHTQNLIEVDDQCRSIALSSLRPQFTCSRKRSVPFETHTCYDQGETFTTPDIDSCHHCPHTPFHGLFLICCTAMTPSAYLFILLFLTRQRLSLLRDTLLSPLTGGLGLSTLGVHLILENLLTLLLGLGLVDLYHTLV
jgi:hypothetical protein